MGKAHAYDVPTQVSLYKLHQTFEAHFHATFQKHQAQESAISPNGWVRDKQTYNRKCVGFDFTFLGYQMIAGVVSKSKIQ